MANHEHVAMLMKGVNAWNEWRRREREKEEAERGEQSAREQELPVHEIIKLRRPESRWPGPDLSGANLARMNLTRVDFVWANLRRANLEGTCLDKADLSRAYLAEAEMVHVNLIQANLESARLIQANLTNAILHRATLLWADARNAILNGGTLVEANLVLANLEGANLAEAALGSTIFGATRLTGAKGLDQCQHVGPSFIDFATLRISDPLPTAFLRGVGLPDNVIDYLPSLLTTAIQHYSCFISYSSKDQAFADRLHADLQNKGVRCWFAPHDMPIGAKIIDAIDEAIRLRDKVLLILSEGAIASDWVEGEVTRAFDEERTRKQVVLFPVRLDDAVMQTTEGWARLLRGQRNIGDFTRWKEHDSYQRSFDRLMRDLRVESSTQ